MKKKRWAAAAVILAVCTVVGLRVSARKATVCFSMRRRGTTPAMWSRWATAGSTSRRISDP